MDLSPSLDPKRSLFPASRSRSPSANPTIKMSESVSSMQRLRQAIGNDHARFATIYAASGLLVVILPAIMHGVRMAKYRHSYYYNYQQQYEEGGASRDVYDINNCKWFNPFCSSTFVNGNGEYAGQNEGNQYYNSVPSWYSGWGTTGVNSRDDASAADSGAVKFVYAWQLIMFLGLLAYGCMTLHKYRGAHAQTRVALSSLSLLVFVWGNVSFLFMWLLANGSIMAGGNALEEFGGFYHQFSVLVFITNFWYVIWSIGAAIAVWRRAANAAIEAESEPMLPYGEPTKV